MSRLKVAAPWAIVAAAAAAAWFLPEKRSTAVLNLLAVLTALYIGLRAYRISRLQAERATLATILSRQPLLTVVHEPVGWPPVSVKDHWFPAEKPFLVADQPQVAGQGFAKVGVTVSD